MPFLRKTGLFAVLSLHSVAIMKGCLEFVFKHSFFFLLQRSRKEKNMSQRQKTKKLVMMGLLIALQIIFVRFLSFSAGNSSIRISLGFFPVAVAGMILGPVGGGLVGIVADFLGMMLFSRGDIYFFPLGVTEFLYGFGFGLMLHKKEPLLLKTVLLTALQFVVLNLGLNTFFLYWYFRLIVGNARAMDVILIGRLGAALINLPVQMLGIGLICRYFKKPLERIVR